MLSPREMPLVTGSQVFETYLATSDAPSTFQVGLGDWLMPLSALFEKTKNRALVEYRSLLCYRCGEPTKPGQGSHFVFHLAPLPSAAEARAQCVFGISSTSFGQNSAGGLVPPATLEKGTRDTTLALLGRP